MQQEYPCIAPQFLHDSSSPSPALAAQISLYQTPKESTNAQPSKYYRRNYDEQTVLTSDNVICRNTTPARYSSASREPSPTFAIQSQTYNASAPYSFGPGQPNLQPSNPSQHATNPRNDNTGHHAEIARQANALGIPQTLPKPPSTTPPQRTAMSAPGDIQDPMVADFLEMTKNYRAMLGDPPSVPTPAPSSTAYEALSAGVDASFEQIFNFLGTSCRYKWPSLLVDLKSCPSSVPPPPEMQNNSTTLTSPSYEYLGTPQLDDFASPPEDTPYNDFLTTPLFDDHDDFLTGPVVDDDTPLITGPSDYMPVQPPVPASGSALKAPLPDNMYTLSPDMPLADSFPPSPYGRNQNELPSSSLDPTYTGTRRNASSSTMIPLDAPTQQRQYRAPSVTARRAEVEDEDEAAKKRRINTVAARRSRKRKAEHMERLTEENERQKRDIRRLEATNERYRQMLVLNGIDVPTTL